MPFNISGALATLHFVFSPRLIVPALKVKDIRQLDFAALHRAGYKGAVFDKDNCLTLPHKDQLVPELQEAWSTCRATFGTDNILIVSNSAGTHSDGGGLKAEAVSSALQVPVLFHDSLKPSYSCIGAIRKYFGSLSVPVRDHELLVVGDRLFTDIVLANRMSAKGTDHLSAPLSVWTTGVWQRESMFMRWCEKTLLQAVQRWAPEKNPEWQPDHFILPPPPPPRRSGLLRYLVRS